MEKVITIPKDVAKKGELVIIPREDYEKLLALKKIPEFQPTAVQKKALIKARRNQKKGNFLTLNELKAKLGFTG